MITAAIFLVLAPLAVHAAGGGTLSDSGKQKVLGQDAGRLLVYLMPEGHELRSKGTDLRIAPNGESKNFYLFAVTYWPRLGDEISTTVGHYAVNKHTGQVWEYAVHEAIDSPELRGVAKLLREARGVSDEAARKYEGLEFHGNEGD